MSKKITDLTLLSTADAADVVPLVDISAGTTKKTTVAGLALGLEPSLSLPPTTLADETTFDHIASGCVWTADSPGTTRVASMTSGVIYINGTRIAVPAVASRTFSASVDTYVDLDSVGGVNYATSANNGASQTLSANRIRCAIVVTGVSSIASAASINQGQEDKVLPIRSSIPMAVTDELGNLICPRDPQRRVLGYRQIVAGGSFSTTSTTQTLVTPLSVPVQVTAHRKIKITIYADIFGASAGTNVAIVKIWDGTVGSGTQLTQTNSLAGSTTNNPTAVMSEVQPTPPTTSGLKTYNVGLSINISGTAQFSSVGAPVFARVEQL